jgi:hypothetical protein
VGEGSKSVVETGWRDGASDPKISSPACNRCVLYPTALEEIIDGIRTRVLITFAKGRSVDRAKALS